MKPKFIMRHSGKYLEPRIKTTKFKVHLMRSALGRVEGAYPKDSVCGFYEIGGNIGRIVTKARIGDVDCKKCLQIFKYKQKKIKMKLPFQKGNR